MIIKKHDVVIVGGGLAGVVSAIELANKGVDVAIVYDHDIDQSASYYAQGGIAAIVSEQDSIQMHIEDTMFASGNTAKFDSVMQVVSNSYNAIKWLEEHGVEFDRELNNKYSLHLEGGHSLARVLHVKDYTGKAIILKLYESLNRLKNVSIYSSHVAFKLSKSDDRCTGVYTYDKNKEVVKFSAQNTILAAGGASGIYKYVTKINPGVGSSMIMAYDIGCRLENLEFTQFHPTCFFGKKSKPLLISEAIRGSGAVLETENGLRIMKSVHEMQDLAPRDIVAREIYINMQAGKDIYLNATHLNGTQWQQKFPYIYKKLLENDIDPAKDRIPISPAAHYSCGGIAVNENSQTNVKNLYAAGEVTYTGLHGANRLASNSLLECIVYALGASRHIVSNLKNEFEEDFQALRILKVNGNSYSDAVTQIKQIMWDNVGLVRNEKKLLDAKVKLEKLSQLFINKQAYTEDKFDYKYEEFRKILLLAQLTVNSAIQRKHSIGSHYIA